MSIKRIIDLLIIFIYWLLGNKLGGKYGDRRKIRPSKKYKS